MNIKDAEPFQGGEEVRHIETFFIFAIINFIKDESNTPTKILPFCGLDY
jgi:predicted transcriptional regulator